MRSLERVGQDRLIIGLLRLMGAARPIEQTLRFSQFLYGCELAISE